MPPPDSIPDFLLEQACGGDMAALGRLPELYRNSVPLIARTLIS
jgi:hypothetical protein